MKNFTGPISPIGLIELEPFMENAIQNKPISIYIPYAFLVTALFSIYIVALQKVELRPFQVEYPEETFIAPSFELPTLAGGKINLSDYHGQKPAQKKQSGRIIQVAKQEKEYPVYFRGRDWSGIGLGLLRNHPAANLHASSSGDGAVDRNPDGSGFFPVRW